MKYLDFLYFGGNLSLTHVPSGFVIGFLECCVCDLCPLSWYFCPPCLWFCCCDFTGADDDEDAVEVGGAAPVEVVVVVAGALVPVAAAAAAASSCCFNT